MHHATVAKPADNRREFERVTPDPHAPVRVHINGDDFIEVTNALDISEGGIRIKVGHRFAGCHVDLPASFIIHLPAPINQHVSVKGRIKHVLNDSFGLQFAALNQTGRELIRRYIHLRAGKSANAGFFQNYFRNLFSFSR